MADDEKNSTHPPQPLGLQKRAVQIMAHSICVTVASDNDDLERVKEIAVELADKYERKDKKEDCN